jgi:hypothetical protein
VAEDPKDPQPASVAELPEHLRQFLYFLRRRHMVQQFFHCVAVIVGQCHGAPLLFLFYITPAAKRKVFS